MNFIIILAIVLCVAVHELGHAFAGKRLGVPIKSISLFGFGPLIFSWRSKFFKGARVGFGLLPYGAYVLFDGLHLRRLGTKSLDDISFAGPHMNFVTGALAGCLFMLCYGINKPTLVITCICVALTSRPIKFFALYAILPFVALYVIGDMLRFESISKSVNEGFFATTYAGKFFDLSDFPKKFLITLTFFNFGLGVLNMLPVYPLDGGHVAKRFAETVLDKEGLPYRLLFFYLPIIVLILFFLPIVGDIKKISSFFF